MSYRSNSTLASLLKNRKKDPLTPLVEEYYLVRGNSKKRLHTWEVPLTEGELRPPGRISPSSIGQCRRKAVFGFVGVRGKKAKRVSLERTFNRGNWIHSEWFAVFKDMELVLGRDRFEVLGIERGISLPRLFIRGRLDVKARIDGEPVVIDIKSASPTSYMFRVYEGADPHHIEQVQPYMLGARVEKGYILYDNKGDQSMWRVFHAHFSQELWATLKRWCLRVIESIEARRLPPMDPACTKDSTMAQDCPYKYLCYSDHSRAKLDEIAFGGKRERFQSAQDFWEEGLRIEKKARKRARLLRVGED